MKEFFEHRLKIIAVVAVSALFGILVFGWCEGAEAQPVPDGHVCDSPIYDLSMAQAAANAAGNTGDPVYWGLGLSYHDVDTDVFGGNCWKDSTYVGSKVGVEWKGITWNLSGAVPVSNPRNVFLTIGGSIGFGR